MGNANPMLNHDSFGFIFDVYDRRILQSRLTPDFLFIGGKS